MPQIFAFIQMCCISKQNKYVYQAKKRAKGLLLLHFQATSLLLLLTTRKKGLQVSWEISGSLNVLNTWEFYFYYIQVRKKTSLFYEECSCWNLANSWHFGHNSKNHKMKHFGYWNWISSCEMENNGAYKKLVKWINDKPN